MCTCAGQGAESMHKPWMQNARREWLCNLFRMPLRQQNVVVAVVRQVGQLSPRSDKNHNNCRCAGHERAQQMARVHVINNRLGDGILNDCHQTLVKVGESVDQAPVLKEPSFRCWRRRMEDPAQ